MKPSVNAVTLCIILIISGKVAAETQTTTTVITNPANSSDTKIIQSTTTTPVTATTPTQADSTITSAIYAKYAKSSALIGTSISVSSVNGVVTLSGTVTAQSQADEAVNLAKEVVGPGGVHSSISVLSNQSPAPQGNTSNY